MEWNGIKDELHMYPKSDRYYNTNIYSGEPFRSKIENIDVFIFNLSYRKTITRKVANRNPPTRALPKCLKMRKP